MFTTWKLFWWRSSILPTFRTLLFLVSETNEERIYDHNSNSPDFYTGNETSVEIAGLDPTASYTILIAAENSAGVGVLSDKTYFMPWTDMSEFFSPISSYYNCWFACFYISATVAVEMPFPTVVVPSYKEGIIMGLCLAVFCVAMSALVLMCRRKWVGLNYDKNWYWHFDDRFRLLRLLPLIGSRFSDQSEQNTQPKPNGHIPNGSVIVETQELQTLLPQLFETRLDAKVKHQILQVYFGLMLTYCFVWIQGGNLNGAIPRMDYLVNGGPVANGACGQPLLNDVSSRWYLSDSFYFFYDCVFRMARSWVPHYLRMGLKLFQCHWQSWSPVTLEAINSWWTFIT